MIKISDKSNLFSMKSKTVAIFGGAGKLGIDLKSINKIWCQCFFR